MAVTWQFMVVKWVGFTYRAYIHLVHNLDHSVTNLRWSAKVTSINLHISSLAHTLPPSFLNSSVPPLLPSPLLSFPLPSYPPSFSLPPSLSSSLLPSFPPSPLSPLPTNLRPQWLWHIHPGSSRTLLSSILKGSTYTTYCHIICKHILATSFSWGVA